MTTEELYENINLDEDVDTELKSAKISRDYIILDARIVLHLGSIPYEVYKRGSSLTTSPNQKYRLTELCKITLEGMNKI